MRLDRIKIGPELVPGHAGDTLHLKNARWGRPPPLRHRLRRNRKGARQFQRGAGTFERLLKGGVALSHSVFKPRLEKSVNGPLMDRHQGWLYFNRMIAERFRSSRLAKGLTLREIGEALDVTPQAVSRWEKVNVRVEDIRLKEIANLLDVDWQWLKGDIGVAGEIIPSKYNKHYGKRVPVIDVEHGILYSLMSLHNGLEDRKELSDTIEPSSKITGQGFAIRITAENKVGILNDGDLAIFDNGISAIPGDYVVAVTIHDNFIRGIIARCVLVEEEGAEKMVLVHDPGTAASKLMEATGGAKPIAVMIEHRRFRSIQDAWETEET